MKEGSFTSEQTSPEAGGVIWGSLTGGEAVLTISKAGYISHEEQLKLERGRNNTDPVSGF
jgi:hypothetical protein